MYCTKNWKKVSNKLASAPVFLNPVVAGRLVTAHFRVSNVAAVLCTPGAADRVHDNLTVTAHVWDWYGCHCLSSLILMHSDVVYLCLTRTLIVLISQFGSDLHMPNRWFELWEIIFVRGELLLFFTFEQHLYYLGRCSTNIFSFTCGVAIGVVAATCSEFSLKHGAVVVFWNVL